MSMYDRQQGMFDGMAIASGETARRYAGAINEWEKYAESLNARLHNAEAKLVKANASRVGLAQLVRAISAELQRADPNNPLLDKSKQLALVESITVEKAAESGYAYDPATGAIKPVR